MKPCPFCNSKDIDIYYDYVDNEYSSNLYFMICNICGTHGPTAQTQEMARKKWEGILLNKSIKDLEQLLKEDAVGGVSAPMSTNMNTPGMGNAVPGSSNTNNIGSGDKWSSSLGVHTQGLKLKKKRIKEGGFVNPYDTVGNAMLKKTKTPKLFKKGKRGTVKQKKFKIKTLDEYLTSSNNLNLTESNTNKKYKIKISRSGTFGNTYPDRFVEGTLAELINHFSYTLEVGKSWENEKGNKKINMNPKTIEQLIKNVENAKDNAASNGYGGYSLEVIEENNVNEGNMKVHDEFDNKELLRNLYISLLYKIPDNDIENGPDKPLYEKYADKYIKEVTPLFTIKKYPLLYDVTFKDGLKVIASKNSRWMNDWTFEIAGEKYTPDDLYEFFKARYLTDVQRLEYEIKNKDWTFEYSDDHSVWKKGLWHNEVISKLIEKLLASGYTQEDINKIWNKHAPKGYERK
jgi:hypothetical protein